MSCQRHLFATPAAWFRIIVGCLAVWCANDLVRADRALWSEANWSPAAQPELADRISEAPKLSLETLAEGPDSCWTGPAWWVPNADGKSWDLVLFYYPEYMGPHHVTIIDFGTGEVKHQEITTIEGARFMFHLAECYLVDGKLYCRAQSSRVALWEYDPDVNVLRFCGFPAGDQVKNGGWGVSADGIIYGVGQASGQIRPVAYRFDPQTGKGEVFEPFGPENPNLAWIYSKVELDGDWIYLAVGNRPWRLLGYNFATQESKVLAETESITGDHKTVQLQPAGKAGGYAVSISDRAGGDGNSERFWLREGELIARTTDTPPWANEGNVATLPIRGTRTLYAPDEIEIVREPLDSDGNVRLWYRLKGDARQAAAWADNKVQAGDWGSISFAAKFFPQPVRHMVTLPNQKIYALTNGYGRAVLYDPKVNKTEKLGAGMSTYAMCEHQGLVYMCGYPSSQIWVYDPSKPWTVGKADARATAPQEQTGEEAAATATSNPRRVASLKEDSHVHMPFGGTHIGADGRVYIGGKVIRTGNGGGLGWWDPKTNQTGGMSEEFRLDQVFWMCTADKGRYILCSTKPVADERDPRIKPERGRIFVFDTKTKEIIHRVDCQQWSVPGYIAEVAPGQVVGFGSAGDGKGVMYGLDVADGEIVWTKPLPQAPVTGFADIRRGRFSFENGPDGRVWTILGKSLVRIDPTTAEVEPVGVLPGNEKVLFCDGRIYVSGGNNFRRIKELHFEGGQLKRQ